MTIDNVANDGNFDLDDNDDLVAADDVRDDVEAVIGTGRPDTLDGGTLVRIRPSPARAATTQSPAARGRTPSGGRARRNGRSPMRR